MRTLLFPVFLSFAAAALGGEKPQHVIIVSLDGAKPAVLQESEIPTLRKLVSEGASTWEASTIFPPKTLPSHTSMLTGVGPDKHGVLWNDYMPIRGVVKVPTVFSLLRSIEPDAVTAMFVGKVKFRHLWQPNTLSVFNFDGPQSTDPVPGTPEIEKGKVPSQQVAKQFVEWLKSNKPRLAFVHLTDIDSAGHKDGWGSPQQKEAVKVTDQALFQVKRAVEDQGLASETVIIVSADHGGHGLTHGENIPDDMLIPWLAWGKGVKKGHSLSQKITTYDTAATALWLLDVPIPEAWDGKPVTTAFDFAAPVSQ